MTISSATLAKRRKALAQRLKDGLAIIPGNSLVTRSMDDTHPFHQNSNFRYLAGMDEPDCAALIGIKTGKIVQEEILCRERDRDKEQWEGERLGPLRAKRRHGFPRSRSISLLGNAIQEAASEHATLHHSFGNHPELDRTVISLLAARRNGSRARIKPVSNVTDWNPVVSAMRMVKDKEEAAAMKKAAEIAVNAHTAAMKAVRSAKRECEVEAKLIERYRASGAVHSFQPIVAAGPNACTLHYSANSGRIRPGHLLLVDSGCQYEGYCSDITRTYPVNGKFSEAQAEIYSVVLAAQEAAIRQVRPGKHLDALERTACRILVKGLANLGLVKGAVDDALKRGSFRRFYPHRIGHWLGLDVHDAGCYRESSGEPVRLIPGMALTVEPGLYIGHDSDIPKRYHGIGVRIEDDLIVTRTGHINLTADLPKRIRDIERLLNS